uniref:Glycosyltransferase 61 catalytic domain-containing protein n=1 Tax=Chromera velia CCMP2878 TaxID=1169474 RepID=A0A0G4I4T5_9ALVE|eukprot:Cvel_10964.t1-p1 / transcript=Cvel_10964.t1 / gene=Cvel_10964 / organism=Chromera_velia_CCMP2878 / gene_product=hypothetical protein / transcript_product=hypothetical protein / location=Cvel_scaffold674:41680-44699(+) / protein_length=506 / sequence_SO=supercontig / SO=protein_coding / is_pseudo=false
MKAQGNNSLTLWALASVATFSTLLLISMALWSTRTEETGETAEGGGGSLAVSASPDVTPPRKTAQAACGMDVVKQPAGRAQMPPSEWCCVKIDAIAHSCWLQNVCIDEGKTQVRMSAGAQLPPFNVSLRAEPIKEGHAPKLIEFRNFEAEAEEKEKERPPHLGGTWGWVETYHHHNFGHIMGDDVFSMFRLLRLFDAEPLVFPDFHMLLPPHWKNNSQWHVLTTPDKVVTFDQARETARGPVFCVDNLFVGISRLGFAFGSEAFHDLLDFKAIRRFVNHKGSQTSLPTAGASDHCSPKNAHFCEEMAAFRKRAMTTLEVAEKPIPHRLSILLVEKGKGKVEHDHRIGNQAELGAMLRAAYPVAEVEEVAWRSVSLQRQVELVARTDIMIVQAGSDAMTAAWLHPAAELIIIGRPDLAACAALCGNELGNWWSKNRGDNGSVQCITGGAGKEWRDGDQVECQRDENQIIISSMLTVPPDILLEHVKKAVFNLQVRGRTEFIVDDNKG